MPDCANDANIPCAVLSCRYCFQTRIDLCASLHSQSRAREHMRVHVRVCALVRQTSLVSACVSMVHQSMSICLDMPCMCVYACARPTYSSTRFHVLQVMHAPAPHTRAHASTSSKSSTLSQIQHDGGLRTRTPSRESVTCLQTHLQPPVRIQILPCMHVTSGLRERATACHTETSHIQRSHLRTPPLLSMHPTMCDQLQRVRVRRIPNRPRNHSHASKNSPAQCAAPTLLNNAKQVACRQQHATRAT
jgi:hypothetical protein